MDVLHFKIRKPGRYGGKKYVCNFQKIIEKMNNYMIHIRKDMRTGKTDGVMVYLKRIHLIISEKLWDFPQ